MKSKGFTLIELLTVIAIILILAGLISAGAFTAWTKTYESKCKAQLAALEVALRCYYLDWGKYPGTSEELVSALTTTEKGGPYMKFKKEDLVASAMGSALLIYDPWNKAFVYDSQTPSHNTASYDLYSCGPDENDDSGDGDDITNW